MNSNGKLIVSDYQLQAVISVDPVSGNRVIVSGDPFGENIGLGTNIGAALGVAIDTNGFIIVARSDAFFTRVNPITGDRVQLHNQYNLGGNVYGGLDIAVDGGYLFSCDFRINNYSLGGKVVEMNQTNGSATIISSVGNTGVYYDGYPAPGTGTEFRFPVDIKKISTNKLVMSDVMIRSLIQVDMQSGNRTTMSCSRKGTGVEIYQPKGITLMTNGFLALADVGDEDFNDGFGNFPDRQPQIVQIDHITGQRSVLSAGSNTQNPRGTGGNFDQPYGVTIWTNGNMIVVDAGAADPKVVRVDNVSGNRTVLSSLSVGAGTNLTTGAYGAAVKTNGLILVSDSGIPAILQINPNTGNRVIVSGASIGVGSLFSQPKGIALFADGSVAVADSSGKIFRVNPNTGDRTIISASPSVGSGPAFVSPAGISVLSDGNLLVVDSGAQSLIKVNSVTGNRTIVSSEAIGAGSLLQSPEFLFIANSPRFGSLNVASGTLQTTLSGLLSGETVVLQTSSDLKNWIPIKTNLVNSSALSFTNTINPVMNSQFFRAVVQ